MKYSQEAFDAMANTLKDTKSALYHLDELLTGDQEKQIRRLESENNHLKKVIAGESK